MDEQNGITVVGTAFVRAAPDIARISVRVSVLDRQGEQARAQAAAIRRTLPRYSVADFLEAFRFDEHGAALFRKGAKCIGMG